MVFTPAKAEQAPSQIDGPYWIADQTGCLAANPAPQENEHVEWTGGCENGKLSGDGVLTWYQNGEVIGRDEGTFAEGSLTGHGTITMGDGATYVGGFPGSGTFTLPSGLALPAQTVRENTGWRIEQVRETGS
jgi:hypothetical protein